MNANIKQINVKRSYTKPSGKVMLETAWKRVATNHPSIMGQLRPEISTVA